MSFSRYYTRGLSFQKANDLCKALNASAADSNDLYASLGRETVEIQCDTEEAEQKALAICSEREVTVYSEPPPRFTREEASAFSKAQRSFEEARERVQELNRQRQVLLDNGHDPDEVEDVINRLVRRSERIAEGDTELARLYEAVKAAAVVTQPLIDHLLSLQGEEATIYANELPANPQYRHYQECLRALDNHENKPLAA